MKTLTKVLLIDLENCPNQLNELLAHLESYSQVVICYAQNCPKFLINLDSSLVKAINDNRLKIVKMPHPKKNAADFGITFWAGSLMAQLDEKTHFDVMSNDTDLDFVVELLTVAKRSARRIGRITTKIIVADVKPVTLSFQTYCLDLAKHPNNKPTKQTTLLNSIKSKFQDKIVPLELLEELVKRGVITINNTKVSYNLQKINTFKTQG